MVCVHSSNWWQLSRIPAASKINRHKEKTKQKQNNNNLPKKKHFVTSVYRLEDVCGISPKMLVGLYMVRIKYHKWNKLIPIITSLAKEVMFLVALVSLSVCLSVCLFVCGQHYSKSYERIGMKFYGRVLSSTRNNWLNFGGDLGIVRWVNEQKNTVIAVVMIQNPFFFFFLGGGGGVVFHNQGSTFLQWAIWE